jgi:hypothetical protein
MPAPEFTLPTTGTSPKVATRLGLEASINAVSQALFDQIGAISTGLKPAGNWDASGGSFPSGAERGTYYVVNVAGTVDGAAFAIGDWLIPLVDGPETGTYAGNWFRGDYSKVVPAKPDSAAAFEAGSDVSRGAGALWETKDGHRYEEVTTGEDLTNAAGVKLKVTPLYGPASPEYTLAAFGEVGTADDKPLIQSVIDKLEALPNGGTLVIPSDVTVTTPVIITSNRVKLKGLGLKSENENPVKIVKAAGFAGGAAVMVGDGVSTVIGFTAENLYVDGNNQDGAGWLFTKTGNVVLRNVMSQANNGWGMIFDGSWITETHGCTARFNGVSGVSGGGILIRCDNRATSNFWGYNWTANQNNNHQMLWTANDADVNTRPVGVFFFGGIFELPGDDGASTALVEIEACDRSGFVACHFPQEINVTPPCLLLGSTSAVHNVDGLSFVTCYFQHNQAGPAYAIVTKENIDNITFIDPRDNVLNSRLIDATLTTSGRIMVVAGDVDPSEYTDPNGVISSVGGNGVQMGLTPATGGGQLLIDPRRASVTTRLGSRDASNLLRYIEVGSGPDRDMATFSSLFPRLPPQAIAPANPQSGTLAISNGSGGGFDGTSGEGLYRRNNANTAWVFVG